MGKRKKRRKHKPHVPKKATSLPDTKKVWIPSGALPDYPSWQFSTADRGGPFAWPENQADELRLVQSLRQFDGMRWAEIEGPHSHSVSVGSLSKEAQDRLVELNLDDLEELFSFRITGRERVFCIKENNIAKLLWWDPNHRVCPSQLKNT